MANDIEQKRSAVATAYPGSKWRDKVLKMSDAQVIAVYFNLKKQHKI
jgi:hypothetical protein